MHNNIVAVDNGITGCTVFRATKGEVVYTFRTQRTLEGTTFGSHFMGDGRWIACGSDHGRVYIYDLQQLATVDWFNHSRRGVVRHIAVRSSHCNSLADLNRRP
jgi:hypothetical protein